MPMVLLESKIFISSVVMCILAILFSGTIVSLFSIDKKEA